MHSKSYLDRLASLLVTCDLDFHEQDSGYSTHNFHAFPAKFPPQLPRLFIESLTSPGDIVLDPMQGSGTTILEAILSARSGIGFDIDPLSVLVTKAKSTPLDKEKVARIAEEILANATKISRDRPGDFLKHLNTRWEDKSREFIDYWFDFDTQVELLALLLGIAKIQDLSIRQFFELSFSSIIITKSGGVSLARDLAHTRPHRAKLIYSAQGEIIEGEEFLEDPPANLKYATKYLRSPLDEFSKRVRNNLAGLLAVGDQALLGATSYGDAQKLPLPDASVDLIITSPPYASNAIDYMRAHKFSLVWLGRNITDLGDLREGYIGGESTANQEFEPLPEYTLNVISAISTLDAKKGLVLRRYYSEMSRVLLEMHRVLKPGKAAIVVVGNSQMRGRDTETQNCLADIGRSHGFDVPAIGVRNLDRDRRMMPAGVEIDYASQIQQRMHAEYVIGFYKP